ncbi:MAG: hypothetical protein ACPG8W_12205 [Candidatus Promineifilaceae bacterium]
MSNDETIFSNRTNQDIDEALAWLDGLTGSKPAAKNKPAANMNTRPAANQYNLPTWLRMDIRVESPQAADEQPANIEDENLSWLDSLVTPAASSIEEPPTMNWQDTDIYNASAQIRAAQAEVRKEIDPADEETADLAALQIDNEPTNITVRPLVRPILTDESDLMTEPVSDSVPQTGSLDQTERLIREPDLDTSESLGKVATPKAPTSEFMLPDIDELLGVPSQYRGDSAENKAESIPSNENDPFLDISEQAIADWLNTTNHGTTNSPSIKELPSYEFDGFPELGEMIAGESVAQNDKTDIILPNAQRPSLSDDDETADLTDVILPDFAPPVASEIEDATEIVLPVISADADAENTQTAFPNPADGGAGSEFDQLQLERDAIAALEQDYADLLELDAEAEKTNILPYELDALPADLQAELLKTAASQESPSTPVVAEDNTQILPYGLRELPDDLLAELQQPDNYSEEAQVLPYDELSAALEETIAGLSSNRSAVPDNADRTEILPYKIPDELRAEVEDIQQPSTPSVVDTDSTQILPYDSIEIPETLQAEIESAQPPVPDNDSMQIVPYERNVLPQDLLDEIQSSNMMDDLDEGTQILPYDPVSSANLPVEVETVDELNEPTGASEAVSKTELDLPVDLPIVVENPDMLQSGLSSAADIEELSLLIPAGLEWLKDAGTIVPTTTSIEADPPAPALEDDATKSKKRTEKPDSDDGKWARRIPMDPAQIAALSAPTIISHVPISERWKQLNSDASETEALDLLDFGSSSPSEILDTLHAGDAIITQDLSPEQLADLTEPVSYEDEVINKGAGQSQSPEFTPLGDLEKVANLAEGIPDDPDEAIAWLEQMARQESLVDTPPVYTEQAEPLSGGLGNAPHFLDDLLPNAPFDEPTTVAPASVDVIDERESFMRQLEEAMESHGNGAEAQKPDETGAREVQSADISEPLPEELSDALAWLEDLVAGSENSIDETTVELNEADVQALLNQAIPEPVLPEPEKKRRAVQKKAPKPAPVPPAVNESLSVVDPEGGELDEALAWLEAFANEESSLILPVTTEEPAQKQPAMRSTRPYDEVRTRAENALALGDHQQVAREYTSLIENEKSTALDIVIKDMTRITKQVTTSPLLYRVLGDAYAKQLNFEMAAQAYRNGLDSLS